MRDLAFLAFFAAYLPLALRFPHVGAMVWAWLSFTSPDDYLFGFMAAVPLSKVVAAATVLSLAARRSGRRPYFDMVMGCMVAFALLGLDSAAQSASELPQNWDLFSKLAKIVALGLVIASVATSRERLVSLVAASALGLAFNGVDEGLKVIATGGGHHVAGLSSVGDNNGFAVAMLIALPILAFLRTAYAHPVTRAACAGAFGLCCLAVFGTYSRGGFIGLLAVLGGMVAGSRRRVRNGMALALAAAMLALAAPSDYSDRINTIGNAKDDGSFMGRVTSWKVATLIALDRPLTGGGFHAQQDKQLWALYAPKLPTMDFIRSDPADRPGLAAHSIYFEVLGDLGFPGLAAFLAMLAAGMAACGGTRRMCRGRADLRWASDLAGMLRLSMLAYMISGAALSFAYFEGIYVVLALASANRRLVSEQLSSEAAARAAGAGPMAGPCPA